MVSVKEIKATCQACQHVWHYLPGAKVQQAGESMQKAGCAMMSCGCSSLLMKKGTDLGQCPKCGSRAVKTEDVVHEVE